MLKPNVTEMSELAGCPFEEECDLEQAAMRLVNEGWPRWWSCPWPGSWPATVRNSMRAPTVRIRSKIGSG